MNNFDSYTNLYFMESLFHILEDWFKYCNYNLYHRHIIIIIIIIIS